MLYFFVLGNHPFLSLAELSQQPYLTFLKRFPEVALFQSAHQLDQSFFQRLGGSQKMGFIVQQLPLSEFTSDVLGRVVETSRPKVSEKFFLGLSVYGVVGHIQKKWQKKIFSWGIGLKKKLKEQGQNMRLVTSRESQLSSVVVQKNFLVSSKGCEFVFLIDHEKVAIGRTLYVQDFSRWSRRDYGRPSRDSRSGMLPPKLARMMMHLSCIATDSVVVDPFCGSGTIIQEAAVLGFSRIIGSDKSQKAVNSSRDNLMWLHEHDGISLTFTSVDQLFASSSSLSSSRISLFMAEVRRLSVFLPPHSVGAIITEPYLGSPSVPYRSVHSLRQQSLQLEKLYAEAFKQWANILVPGGKVVMVWPFFRFGKVISYLEPTRIVSLSDYTLFHWPSFVETNHRGALEYARPQQHVGREIWFFVRRDR